LEREKGGGWIRLRAEELGDGCGGAIGRGDDEKGDGFGKFREGFGIGTLPVRQA
jgi:hypothetical protein